jgi:carbonyl reductase 1
MLAPLLPSDGAGRVVNVCSSAGKLSIVQDPTLRARFEGPTSTAQLDALAAEFVAAIEAGEHKQRGWPSSMYGVSKLLESSYTRVLAEQLRGRNIMVNALCPGWCATDMSSHSGPKSAAEGADTPVWLALLPPSEFVTGCFFADRKHQPF